MKLLIGIVTCNSGETIKDCLDSLSDAEFGSADYSITILDNNSDDDTTVLIRDENPDIQLIESNENKGYSYGVNKIAESSDWDHLLILNPDIQIVSFDFPHVIGLFSQNPNIGLIGANLTDPDNNPVHSFGDLPTPEMLSFDFSGLRSLIDKSYWSSYRSVTGENKPFAVGYVTGAFMLIPRLWWDKVGAFDEKYFLYFEDTDWAFRLKSFNGQAFVDPSIVCIHKSGASFKSSGKSDEFKLTCFFDSAYKYLSKHYGSDKSREVYKYIINRAKLKKRILSAVGKSNSDSFKRQQMIICIHESLNLSSD